jgi:hypothetical protein
VTGRDTSAPLIGRERELAALCEVVRKVRRGGQIGVVEGEAGICKSRLIVAALATASAGGVAVLSSQADELDLHRPFAAILDVGLDGGDEEWRNRIAAAMRLGQPGPDVEGERRFMSPRPSAGRSRRGA